jgi:hypothetical protein
MLADGAGVAIGWLAAPPRTINFLIRVEAIPIWRKNIDRFCHHPSRKINDQVAADRV